MTFVDEMRNLREDIESKKEVRRRRIKEISQDLASFVRQSGNKRREDFKALRDEINKFLAELKRDVKSSQKENQAKQRALARMLIEAREAFWGKEGKELTNKGGE